MDLGRSAAIFQCNCLHHRHHLPLHTVTAVTGQFEHCKTSDKQNVETFLEVVAVDSHHCRTHTIVVMNLRVS
jgi:hypothetical protein